MGAATALPVPTEHEEQCALIRWAATLEWVDARLGLLFAIPNGGARHPAVAAKLRAEGVKPGVPDMLLPVAYAHPSIAAASYFHGLFIELKRTKGGTVQPEQRELHERLRRQGYAVAVCKGWIAAAREIAAYLGMPADTVPTEQVVAGIAQIRATRKGR